MKLSKLATMIAAALTCFGTASWAGSITLDTSDIAANQPISATNMVIRFTAIQTGVNGNASDIAGHTTDINALKSTVGTSATTGLQGDVANLKGNLTGGTCVGNDGTDIMVRVGPLCVDKYEASIWSAKTGGSQVPASSCSANGNDCTYAARSVNNVAPADTVTWFQAQQACANAGKRLLTNAEWQMAAAGTPDDASCNLTSGTKANTGANAACVSRWSVNDMVGNVNEWVADWMPGSTVVAGGAGGTNTAEYGTDTTVSINQAYNGGTATAFPAALYRGGGFGGGTGAGVFHVNASFPPSFSANVLGFRCAR
jgi:hypothetical protein